MASAAALVASHCVEMARAMGAHRDQISTVIRSAVSTQATGDIMVLTDGATTGDLHWKQVSIYVNSSWQVAVKMKSTHMGGTFVKKKKCVVKDVCPGVPPWLGRDMGDGSNQRTYFGIKTPKGIIV